MNGHSTLSGPLLFEPSDKMIAAAQSILDFKDMFDPRRLIRLLWRSMALVADKERGLWVSTTETYYNGDVGEPTRDT